MITGPTKLYVLRRAAGLNQYELAAMVDVKQPRISQIESGKDTTPPMHLLDKIHEVLVKALGDKVTVKAQELTEPYA